MYIKNKSSLLSLAQNEDDLEVISLLTELIEETLDLAQPSNLMNHKIAFTNTEMIVNNEKIDLSVYNNYYLLAFGKASQTMSNWFLNNFPLYFSRIILVSPNDLEEHYASLSNLSFFKAGHPIPNNESLEAAKYSLEYLNKLSSDDLCIVLVSGGGSSLFESPDYGLSLEDYQSLVKQLLASGATIHEINTIRKHFSSVKGGKLALKSKARMITIIMSDVIGNDISSIASGPTAPDETTWEDCKDILEKYLLFSKIPEKVKRIITKGINGELEDTPSDLTLFSHVSNSIIGDNISLLKKLVDRISKNYYVKVLTHSLKGEAREKGRDFAITSIKQFEEAKKSCKTSLCFLVFSGETTVSINTSAGLGGRNQELALAFALEISTDYHIYLASFGTDGIDGNSLAAGALVGPFTLLDENRKQKAITALEKHDSNTFFKENKGEIITGYTGTNLLDIGIICLRLN